jgi:4-hydroxy-2-oxoheptanedioate aldolase
MKRQLKQNEENKMKTSKIATKLRNGKIVVTAKLNLDGKRAPDLIAGSGFDCLWLDMEHAPNDISEIESQIYSSKANGAEVIVRVKRGSYSSLIQPLEAGANGIMVPHVMSAEDAKEIAMRTRFHPIGRRPLDGGNSDNSYGAECSEEYIRKANSETIIILQVEDPEPMEELDKIAAIEGYDILFFGPGDYSHALGMPGRLDAPEIEEARRKIAKTALKHGKIAGTTGSPDNLEALIQMGYTYINVASDVHILRTGMLSCAEKSLEIINRFGRNKQSY